jgi:hypothetical protein
VTRCPDESKHTGMGSAFVINLRDGFLANENRYFGIVSMQTCNTQSPSRPGTSPGRQYRTYREDRNLVQIVKQVETKDWNRVASLIQTRTRSQCSQRWRRSLDPEILKSGWSPDEDALLVDLIELNRVTCWVTIFRVIRTKTDLQSRDRWLHMVDSECSALPRGKKRKIVLRSIDIMLRIAEGITQSEPSFKLTFRHKDLFKFQ